MRRANVWKKAACVALSLLYFLQIKPQVVQAADYWPEGPEVQSPSVILMEMSTGTVLYEKNSDERNYPASITKIMTTLLALENSDLNEVVTFSDDAINNTEGSGIYRDYGEQMTMEQCLYAVMLNSANECAYAVAEHVGGTVEHFVDMMNEKAAELGCTNTHFANPHGLFDENHYTTAHDMALIAKAAYQNETFRIITGTARYTIPPTNKHDEPTDLQMGFDPIRITDVSSVGGSVYVMGKNFTESSFVFIDGKKQDTVFLNENTLMVSDKELEGGEEVYVAQLTEVSAQLSSTEVFIYGD